MRATIADHVGGLNPEGPAGEGEGGPYARLPRRGPATEAQTTDTQPDRPEPPPFHHTDPTTATGKNGVAGGQGARVRCMGVGGLVSCNWAIEYLHKYLHTDIAK